MRSSVILTGDICFLGVEDPALPFRKIADTLHDSDVLFGNLECCLYDPPQPRTMMPDDVSGYSGFYASPKMGSALRHAGFCAVGNANNQNYGAEAIMASNAKLDELGIAHTGAGINRVAACAPVIVERKGIRYGFIQRTSHYWANGHEAGEGLAGVAAIKAYTAYQPPYYKDADMAPDRPGLPAKIVTWCNADYLTQFRDDVSALRAQCDIVVASHHWGVGEEVLQYQQELAHAAIDAGADIVMGHGPHTPGPIEIYKGKPIYYSLGFFYFIRSNRKFVGNWIGMIARITLADKQIAKAAYSFVRLNAERELVLRTCSEEQAAVAHIEALSKKYGTRMQALRDLVAITQG